MRNHSAITRFSIRTLWMVLMCGISLLIPSLVQAARLCSPHVGKITLNEYNYIDNFTEIKKLEPALNLSGWRVLVYDRNGWAGRLLPSGGANSCLGGIYQVSQFASNEISQNADVVLLDNNDDFVDVVRVRTSMPVTETYFPWAIPACGFLSPPYDLQVSSSNKGVDRLPDGNGGWRNTPGTGSNSFSSRCGPNIIGGRTDLAVIKTASATSVPKGSSLTFTIQVTNNGPDSAVSTAVEDLLPTGFSYSSHSTTVGTYSPSTGVWSIGTLANGSSATLTLSVTTTAIGNITNTATVNSQTFDYSTSNNSSSVTVSVVSGGASLDAVEPGAAPGTRIFTKMAGQSFDLDLLALDSAGNISTGYNRTVTIQLVDAGSSATCSAMAKLQDVGTYTFTGSGKGNDNGRKTYTFQFPNAAANVRVRMIDNSSTPITSCSTDNFSVRPHSLAVAGTNATSADSTGTSTSATPVIKAGASFTLSATAVNASSTALTGYNGTPSRDANRVAAHTGAIAMGTVNGAFGAASSGVATGTNFTYSEVGYFRLLSYAVLDSTFAMADQPGTCRDTDTCDCHASSTDANNDGIPDQFSPVLINGKYGCDLANTTATNYFGRFVPNNLAITPGSIIDRAGINTGSTETCSSLFSYMGEEFKTTFILTAQNTAGTTTQNYTGGHARFALNNWSNYGFAGSSGTLTAGAATPAGVWGSAAGTYGRASMIVTHKLTRPTSPVAPYAAFQVSAAPSYTDGSVTISASNAVVHSDTTEMRFGRLKLSNAHGSDRLNLPVPLEAQYWSGAMFVTNTLDSCTRLTASNFVFGNYQNLDATNIGPSHLSSPVSLSSGKASVTLAKPVASASNPRTSGSVDIAISLGITPGDSSCPSSLGTASAAANMPFLQAQWCGTGSTRDPRMRATFGVYKGGPLIYMREVF